MVTRYQVKNGAEHGDSDRLRAETGAGNRLAEARVFIIDDNSANIALLKAMLARAGYQNVFTENDSRRILHRLPEVDPDLIILDLHMPHLDGFAVLRQVRGFAPSEYLPVLVLTADSTSAASENALEAGAQDFVTKPFNNAEVLLRSRNLLEARFLYTTLRGSIIRQTDDRNREERRLNMALASEQEAVERLRSLDELKDTLLQTVSHDLRNPITAVLTMTAMLAADAQETQPLSTEMRLMLIAKVDLSVRQMDRLLRDLLDSDPMRHNSTAYQLCDVGELVRRVLADVELVREHPVQTDIASVTVGVDPVHVERIVENLLANARQHVAAGVTIWVKTAAQDDGVLISVEDAGTGIPTEAVKTIFHPFRRGTDVQSSGLGLGLSLVSRFATLHGGRAWVETRLGGGAAFHVFLPSRLPC